MRSYNYTQSDSDHTLFYKHNQGRVIILIIYVDDMIITGNDTKEIESLEERLSKEFEMKSLGGLKYFLGIEVMRSKQGIYISQRKYMLDLLAEVEILGCKPADTLIIQNLRLKEHSNDKPTNKERY
jgi:Reverse transcriptase (RNA-dependent DNA polymerase)